MSRFAIIDAKPWHCGQMIRLLRAEHAAVIAKLGGLGHRSLRAAFEESSYARAWTVDGRLAGLGGVMGPTLSSSGFIWLALSQDAMAHPIAVTKEAKRQLSAIMEVKRELTTRVFLDDPRSFHFARFLGFRVIAEKHFGHEVSMIYDGSKE
jgi:hypothetical protein